MPSIPVNYPSGGRAGPGQSEEDAMLQAADLTIKLNPADDVVIARVEIPAGTELMKEGVRVAVNVPAGHKIAVRDIAEGKPVRRYNQIIGYSTKPIRAGEHVHVQNQVGRAS